MTKETDKNILPFPADSGEILSRSHQRLLDVSSQIHLDPHPTNDDIAYMARQLVQVTLPHRNPGPVPVWQRTNGNLTLSIRPGWDNSQNRLMEYPCGTLPRLLLFWITTEVLRNKSRKIELGQTLTEFMRKLGLDPSRGGKRSDAHRLRSQMERLFQATISFDQSEAHGSVQGKRWMQMPVAPQGELWWDVRSPGQITLFESWVQLGETFFESIIANPVPVDMRALHALRQSPLALDLYAWLTYRTYRVTKNDKVDFIPWRSLQQQMGTDYGNPKDFKRKAKEAIRKITTVYPTLRLDEVDGGIKLYPSLPAIRPKQ